MTMITAMRSSWAYLGRRAAAYFVDTGLIYGSIIVTQMGVLRTLGIAPAQSADGLTWERYILATITLPVVAYFAVSESSSRRATVGKRWLGLQVTDQAGQQLSFERALLRAVIKFLPFEVGHVTFFLPTPIWNTPNEFRSGNIVVLVLLAMYVAVFLATPKHQGVHDLVAQTVVTDRDA